MAAAAAVARPFGIVPRDYMDLSILLEPLAGPWSTYLFAIALSVYAGVYLGWVRFTEVFITR